MRFFIKMCVSPLDLWSLDLSKKACGEQTNQNTKKNGFFWYFARFALPLQRNFNYGKR